MKQSTICIFITLVLMASFSFLLFIKQSKAPEIPVTPENVQTQNMEAEIGMTYQNASANDISVELPYPGAVTGKEFGVIGKARGYWFFEGSFPIEVRDNENTILATGVATALGEWMTEDFVKFVSEVKVPETYIGPAYVILKKDNPSGEPERDASVSFPVTVEY